MTPPAPRKCETQRCDHAAVEPVLTPRAIDQTNGAISAWVFDCECGWRRVEPVRAPADTKIA